MWICGNCGTNNGSEYRFCVGCGQPRAAAERRQAPPRRDYQPAPAPRPVPGPSRRPIWPWALAGVLLLALAGVLLALVLGGFDREPEPTAVPIEPVIAAPDQPAATAENGQNPNSSGPVIILPAEPSPAATPAPTPTPEPASSVAETGLLTDASQIDSRGLQQLCALMDGVIANNVRTTWGSVEHLNRSEYVGFYLLAAKDENARTRNMLILVYRNDVSVIIPAENVNKSLSYYYSLRFENVQRGADGSLLLGDYREPGDTVNADIYRHNFYYNGHRTLDEVYNAWVKPYESGYTVSRAGSLP